ncbi:hypothetical protein CAPTEDRAFT_202417 [Capitella teleta]|uniref:Uncharacterized protein n=1 Tax=Capitella teleta TaxID=283909 RepID=R7U025_CAPTE|nr:hypothetical protein CAPTEDRAFT_202417 [Capitella teleta]|eukprot:ELT99217.1 hypothetical protein CAPTEDRAFT_202417 [Capitella teleta]
MVKGYGQSHRRLLEEEKRNPGIVTVGTSPKFSPIEHLWDKLKSAISHHFPSLHNSRELIQGCTNIPQGRAHLHDESRNPQKKITTTHKMVIITYCVITYNTHLALSTIVALVHDDTSPDSSLGVHP